MILLRIFSKIFLMDSVLLGQIPFYVLSLWQAKRWMRGTQEPSTSWISIVPALLMWLLDFGAVTCVSVEDAALQLLQELQNQKLQQEVGTDTFLLTADRGLCWDSSFSSCCVT
jgi:hypothetical protein